MIHPLEQDKPFDIEQESPFGSNKLSQMRGLHVQNQREHHTVHPTVVSERKSSSGMLMLINFDKHLNSCYSKMITLWNIVQLH